MVLALSSLTPLIGNAEEIVYSGGSDEASKLVTQDGETIIQPKNSTTGNKITVSNSKNLSSKDYKAPDYVIGGLSNQNDVTSNVVTIDGGYVTKLVKGGHAEGGHQAKDNTVNISGQSQIGQNVYGGFAINGDVTNNTVNLNQGTLNKKVVGGSASQGNATSNKVVVNDGLVNGQVQGGAAVAATDDEGHIIPQTGNVEQNQVEINGGTFNNNIVGGIAENGNAISNKVTITAGTFDGKKVIYGGYSIGSGDVSQNSVIINGSSVGVVSAGYSDAGNVSNNTVSISGADGSTTKVVGSYGGFVNDSGTDAKTAKAVKGNVVTINKNTEVSGNIFGGFIDKGVGTAGGSSKDDGNKVNISGGTVGGSVYGGRVSVGEARNNVVTIAQGEVKGEVGGGLAVGGSATSNKVVVSGGTITGQVFGGAADAVKNGKEIIQQSGNANQNEVEITGGTFNDSIAGGITENGNAVSNKVTITAGEFKEGTVVYGGYTEGSGEVSGNSVIIKGGKLHFIKGGYATSGNVTNNTVVISGADGSTTEVLDVAGGTLTSSGSGDAVKAVKGNVVVINKNVNVKSNVTGAFILKGDGTAGGSNNDDGNKVNIDGGSIKGSVYGAMASHGEAINNIVTMSAGIVEQNIYGGYAEGGKVTSNKVALTGGEVYGNVIGGGASAEQNENDEITHQSGEAFKNEVEIKGVKVAGNVFGGRSDSKDANSNKVTLSSESTVTDVIGGYSGLGAAKFNSITIQDASSISGDVYGGKSTGGDATGNIVTLTGEGIKISGSVYGGYDDADVSRSASNVFQGNTLYLNGFKGELGGIYNFENYNWVLPKNVVNGDTIVHITGTDAVDLANTKHVISLQNDGKRLAVDDKITLIDKTKNGSEVKSLEVKQGNFIVYDMKLEQEKGDDNSGYVLTALKSEEITNPEGEDSDKGGSDKGGSDKGGNKTDEGTNKPKELAGRLNPQTKAFSEARAASLGFLNQGADLIANSGIRSAKASVAEGADKTWDMNLMPFFAIDGSSNRYKTGSHADVDGFNMAVGLASGFELAGKHAVTLGAFFEYGRGTYNTYNSFANYASVRGDGDTHYTGGGILGRIDFAGTGLGKVGKLEAGQNDGLYAEASLRAGHIDTDFDTNDILGIAGASSKYDSGADYFGLHGGVGYVMNFDERNSVDVYGRYFWTKIDSETVTIGRDKLSFDDADSSRIRIGTRYTMIYNQQLTPYVGVAYDHEFDGEVAAHAYGFKLNKPSLDGDTGIFEAGVSMKPLSTMEALSVDVNGQGFVGKREGGGGGVKIKYQF